MRDTIGEGSLRDVGGTPAPWDQPSDKLTSAAGLVSRKGELAALRAERQAESALSEQELMQIAKARQIESLERERVARELAEAEQREAEYQAGEALIREAMLRGDYKPPIARAHATQEKRNLIDLLRAFNESKQTEADSGVLSAGIDKWTALKDRVRSAWVNIIAPASEIPNGVEVNKEVVASMLEVEDVRETDSEDTTGEERDFVDINVTDEGVMVVQNGEDGSNPKKLDEVRIGSHSYAIPTMNRIGKGTFGEVFLAEEILVVGDEDDEGALTEEVTLNDDGELDTKVVKVIIGKGLASKAPDNDESWNRELVGAEMVGQLVGAKKLVGVSGREAMIIVMDKAEGREMYNVMNKRQTELATPRGRFIGARAMMSVLKDLKMIHNSDYAHKDIKPENIILDVHDPDSARLIDHGLVKSEQETLMETKESGSSGTIAYFNGSSWNTGESRKDSDLYALGLSFAEMFGNFIKRPVKGMEEMNVPIWEQQRSGRYLESPNLDDPDIRHAFFQTLQTEPEREFAQLLYDMVRPHDNISERPASMFENELVSVNAVINRLEGIIDKMQLTSRASILLENARSGNAPEEFGVAEFTQLENAIAENNVDEMTRLVRSVDSLYSEGETRNVERVRILTEQKEVLAAKLSDFHEPDNVRLIDLLGMGASLDDLENHLVACGIRMESSDLDKANEHIDAAVEINAKLEYAINDLKHKERIWGKNLEDFKNDVDTLLKENPKDLRGYWVRKNIDIVHGLLAKGEMNNDEKLAFNRVFILLQDSIRLARSSREDREVKDKGGASPVNTVTM